MKVLLAAMLFVLANSPASSQEVGLEASDDVGDFDEPADVYDIEWDQWARASRATDAFGLGVQYNDYFDSKVDSYSQDPENSFVFSGRLPWVRPDQFWTFREVSPSLTLGYYVGSKGSDLVSLALKKEAPILSKVIGNDYVRDMFGEAVGFAFSFYDNTDVLRFNAERLLMVMEDPHTWCNPYCPFPDFRMR